jgi:Flp pilus assembly protein TadB
MNLASVRRLLASGRCAWMLAWALCLPLAQVATSVHALQHLRTVAAENRDRPGQLPLACDVCVAAAAIGGPAPAALLVAQRRAPVTPFYSSRAPPLLAA